MLGAEGMRSLELDGVSGEDPLAQFGPNASAHLLRTDGFEHCPDIVVNSTYWSETEEVAAFEELVGSHGGIGGPQSYPFLCHPARLQMPAEPVVGAEQIHHVLRGWLAELGQQSSPPTPGAAGRAGEGRLTPPAPTRSSYFSLLAAESHLLARTRDLVAAIDDGSILLAGAAVDFVAAVIGRLEPVVAGAAREAVLVGTAIEPVLTGVASEHVLAGTTREGEPGGCGIK